MAYWCVYLYGNRTTVCSKHQSLKAAENAARRCEKRGGTYHQILKVTQVPRLRRKP